MRIEDFTVFAAFLLYLVTAICFALKREWAWALVWVAYSVANLGLIWASKK
jgi:hypothetical protein